MHGAFFLLTSVEARAANAVSGENCGGTIADGGTNLQFPGTTCGATIPSSDPLLQGLANNGGPTQTRSLGPGSPAIDAAGGCPPTTTDQRGVSRPQGSACEIGSFECQTGECTAGIPTATPTPTVSPTATPTPQGGPAAVAPKLSRPMLALFGLALAAAALLFLRK